MTTSATQNAIGALKLVPLHLDHPTTVPAQVLRDASAEAIERLQSNTPHAEQLVELYTQLLDILPARYLPYVTLTKDPLTPYGAVIGTRDGHLVLFQVAKSVSGLLDLVRLNLPKGCGESDR